MKNKTANILDDAKLSFNILYYTTGLISLCYGHFCAKSNSDNYFNTGAILATATSATLILLSISKMQPMINSRNNITHRHKLITSLSLFLLGTSGLILTGLNTVAYNAAYLFTRKIFTTTEINPTRHAPHFTIKQ